MQQSLTWDQRHTLAQLQLLLRRRCLVESLGLAEEGRHVVELLRALDEAIVSAYRLARALEAADQADALLAGFRAARLFPGNCLDAPPGLDDPPER